MSLKWWVKKEQKIRILETRTLQESLYNFYVLTWCCCRMCTKIEPTKCLPVVFAPALLQVPPFADKEQAELHVRCDRAGLPVHSPPHTTAQRGYSGSCWLYGGQPDWESQHLSWHCSFPVFSARSTAKKNCIYINCGRIFWSCPRGH